VQISGANNMKLALRRGGYGQYGWLGIKGVDVVQLKNMNLRRHLKKD
jgi:hypothetical protein